MSKISKIIDFIERLTNPKYLKKVRFEIIEFEKEKFTEYDQSIHWFLVHLVDRNILPQGVHYMGTYGKDENKIVAYFDERRTKPENIENFLTGQGIKVKNIQS